MIDHYLYYFSAMWSFAVVYTMLVGTYVPDVVGVMDQEAGFIFVLMVAYLGVFGVVEISKGLHR